LARGGRRRSDLSYAKVQAPLYRQEPGYMFRWRFGRLPAPWRRRPWPHPLTLLWQRHFIKCLSPGPASGGHIPSPLPRIPSWGRVFGLSLVGRGRGARHFCPAPLTILSGPFRFRQDNRWEVLSPSPGSSPPRWSRQLAAGTAGPSDGAGLLVLKSRELLGRQPAYCLARDAPPKSSPRH
jgi:hypothetical protein